MKKPFKIGILQIIAKVSYYLGLTHLSRFCFSRKNKIIILMYHRISDINNCDLDLDIVVTPKEFERQMEYISKNYNPISFNELMECLENKKNLLGNSVIVTIDDGYKDCYMNAYPILQRYKVPATLFLATNYIDSQELYWWDKVAYAINKTNLSSFSVPELGTYTLRSRIQRAEAIRNILKKLKKMKDGDKNKIVNELVQMLKVEIDNEVTKELFLTWEEIKEMSENGMDFGAHTCSHAILTRVPFEQAKNEIIKSKSVIEGQINKKVDFFAYPGGTINDFDERIKETLKNDGFKAAVTTIHGINKLNSEIDLYSLKRIDINANIGMYLFKLELTGMLDSLYWIRNKLKRKG